MASLSGKITDVTSSPPDSISSITVKAPSARIGGGTEVITSSPANVDFNPTTGDVTISGLTGGLSWLYIEGDGWSDSIPLAVAEGMITLVEAIANAAGTPGMTDYVRLLARLELAVDEVAQDAVDAAAEDIAWHQDTPDSSWNIEDFPKGIWKIENAAQRTRLGLPNSFGVLAMHVYSPDRQSVQNAKTAYWLSLSHSSPTRMLIRSTNNVGVWEAEWQPPFRYEPPTKQAAVPLTFPRGSSYSDDRPTLTIRIPFKFGAAVKRARLRLRNYDYRSDHGFPGSYRIVGAGIGKHQINDDGSMTGLVPEGESITQLMDSTQMTGPDEAAGEWVDINLEANTEYLLSYSFTADDGMIYTRQTGQCFTNRLSSGWNRVGSVTATPSNMAVLAAILDVEVLEDTPIYGYLGDSQTAAISASRPGYDSWAMVHSRLAGAIPTIYGHAGGGLNEWQDPVKPAYNISDGMAKFDRFHISMGSNDISGGRPFTGVQEYLTTVMQNWRNQTDTFVLHNYLPRTEENPTDTVRNALNDWIINDLPGNALYAVDVYGATVDPVTGLMDERWRGSINDVHMNSAGNARVALATVAGTSGSGGGETAAAESAAARAYAARDEAISAAQSATEDAEQTGLDRTQTGLDLQEVISAKTHIDQQVDAIDTTFTDSIPPYLQPDSTTGLQAIYGRGVHVKTFGAVGDGLTDDTAAIQAAVSSGKALYWGDASDVYRVTAQIELRATTPVVWNSDGARIVSEATEATQRVIWVELQGNPISISGPLAIDANRNAYSGIYIANANDTAVPATIRDLTVLNPYRSAKAFTGGDGIALRGGFTTITLDRPVVKNVAMAPGAGTAGAQGVSGISITALTSLRSPRDVIINAPFIDGVYDENTESNIDQDGIKVFGAEDTAGYLLPFETKFLITGGTIRNCGGRAVKSQTEWGVVDGVKIYRGQARVRGGADIDFQVGGGQVSNITSQYEGNAPSAVVNFSGPATAGKLSPHGSVSGLKVLTSGDQSPEAIVTFNQRASTVSNVTVRDIEVVGNQPEHVVSVNGVSGGHHSAIISEVYAAPTWALVRGAFGSPNGWTGDVIISSCINTGNPVLAFRSSSGELASPQVHHSNLIGFTQ